MSERVTIDTDKVRWAREIQKEQGGEMIKEKNPKQVLIDWVTEVQKAANQVCKDIDRNCFLHAKETTNYILGQCNTMMTVLKNSD